METGSPKTAAPGAAKTLWYTLFALAVLVMSWEANLNAAALVAPDIPEDAIRIRILAHSDSPQDQWIKKKVRDAITAEVAGWNLAHADADEARALIADRLPALQQLAAQTLDRYGFGYGAEAQLTFAAFPAKVFAGTVYPAGDYEALLITLGAGRGENWWCVLFPPLCFGGGTVKAKEAATSPSGDGEQPSGTADGKKAKPPHAVGEPEETKRGQGAGELEKAKRETREKDAGETEKAGEAEQAAEAEKAAEPDRAKRAAADEPDSPHRAEKGKRAGRADPEPAAKKGRSAMHDAGETDSFAAMAGSAPAGAAPDGGQADDVEVRFFFADLFKKAAAKLKAWFA